MWSVWNKNAIGRKKFTRHTDAHTDKETHTDPDTHLTNKCSLSQAVSVDRLIYSHLDWCWFQPTDRFPSHSQTDGYISYFKVLLSERWCSGCKNEALRINSFFHHNSLSSCVFPLSDTAYYTVTSTMNSHQRCEIIMIYRSVWNILCECDVCLWF